MDRRGRWGRWFVLVVAVAAAAGAGWWGGRITLAPTETSLGPSVAPVTATVQQASVGRTVSFNVTVSQPFSPVATNSLSGIVTMVGTGAEVKSGDALFAVAGRGVYAVAGTTPFYRDLARDTSGPDVTQLQDALAGWGFAVANGGTFDEPTVAAVKAWQTATGQSATGVIPLGTMLAMPKLPAIVKLGTSIVLGAQVVGGESAVLTRAGEPTLSLVLNQEQAATVPTGASVDVHSGKTTWPAVVAGSSIDQYGNTSLELTGPDGSLVCGSTCGSLPADEQVTLRADVHLVPETNGPAVPVAAVRTAADGSTHVVLADGSQRVVTVKASGDGLAVIDGLEAGAQVVVFDGAVGQASGEGSPPTPEVSDGSHG